MYKKKCFPCYAAALFISAALLSAGCAKHDVVRKDEGVTPAPVSSKIVPTPLESTPSRQNSAPDTAQDSSRIVPAQSVMKESPRQGKQTALEKIYFNFDSSALSEDARSTLSSNAALLTKNPHAKIRIEGNCDERGSAEYNLALGERRAIAAHQYLVTLGVKPARLSIVSFGNEKPSVRGSNEAGWAKNRRDEFVFIAP